MNPITHPKSDDRFSWLWLAIGAVLLPLVQYQTVWPLAATGAAARSASGGPRIDVGARMRGMWR